METYPIYALDRTHIFVVASYLQPLVTQYGSDLASYLQNEILHEETASLFSRSLLGCTSSKSSTLRKIPSKSSYLENITQIISVTKLYPSS